MGNKDFKELVVFMALLGSAADRATQDGLQVSDVQYLMPPMMAAPEAFKGIENIPAEAKDIDQAELLDINQAVGGALDLHDDKLEVVVEKAIGAVINLYGVYTEIQAIRNA